MKSVLGLQHFSKMDVLGLEVSLFDNDYNKQEEEFDILVFVNAFSV